MIDKHITQSVKNIYGKNVKVTGKRSIGGGCINRTSMIELSNGQQLFLKENSAGHTGLFRAEFAGLEALGAAAGPRVPKPVYLFENNTIQLLFMEYIPRGNKSSSFFSDLGRSLAELHKSNTGNNYGFHMNNHIGETPQINDTTPDWIDFFAKYRLEFQVRLAEKRGLAGKSIVSQVYKMIKKLPDLLRIPEAPALIHGDLWGGNIMADQSGEPVIIDPAVYYGDREADIAMTELFGGFSDTFYRSYNETYPLEPGYPQRRDIYNLYHMLNHLNIFGRSYESSVTSILGRYI